MPKPDFKLYNELFDLVTPEKILKGVSKNNEILQDFYKNILTTDSTLLTIDELKNNVKDIKNINFYINNIDSTNKKDCSIIIDQQSDEKENQTSFFDRSLKDISNLDLFFNTIPTIELAQLVPYLSVRFLFKVNEGDISENYLKAYPSLQNFLSLDMNENSVRHALNLSQVKKTEDKDFQDLMGSKKTALLGSYFVTDQSIFTSPVTLSDNFKPFLSITKLDVKVSPSIDYAVAFEEFNLNLVLHDRTKMGKFPHLFGVEFRDQVYALIEYGWSHPGDSNVDHYAYFFNKVLRKKVVCNLTNASYNFDEIGQVKIDMKLHTLGVQNLFVTSFHTDGNVIEAKKRVANLKNSIGKFLSKCELPLNLRGNILLQSLSSGTVEKLEKADHEQLNDLISKIEKTNKLDNESIKDLKKSIENYTTFLNSKNTVTQAINTVINNKFNTFKTTWLKKYRASNNYSKKDEHKYGDVYLHEVFSFFVSEALLNLESTINEVQFIYYNFGNDSLPGVKNLSIGEFEIYSDDLKNVIIGNKSSKDYSIEQFINVVLRKFVGDLKTPAYKLIDRNTSLYSTDKKTYDQAESDTSKILEKKLKSVKNQEDFKEPKISFRLETIGNIIRIHVFDQNKNITLNASAEETQLLDTIIKNKKIIIQNKDETSKANQIKDLNNLIDSLNQFKPKSFEDLKNKYKLLYPKIDLNGSSTNVVKSFQLSNSMDPATTTHLIMQNNAKSDNRNELGDEPNKTGLNNLYRKVVPGKITMQTLGFPIADVHHTFFIDLKTGTDVDNLYNIISVNHSIEPGSFKTNIELANADTFGSHTNIFTQVNKIKNYVNGKIVQFTDDDFKDKTKVPKNVKK